MDPSADHWNKAENMERAERLSTRDFSDIRDEIAGYNADTFF
jgi:hypothetical protein